MLYRFMPRIMGKIIIIPKPKWLKMHNLLIKNSEINIITNIFLKIPTNSFWGKQGKMVWANQTFKNAHFTLI